MDKQKYGSGDGYNDRASPILQRSALGREKKDSKPTSGMNARGCPYAEGATSSSLHSSDRELDEDEADSPHNRDEAGSDGSNSGKYRITGQDGSRRRMKNPDQHDLDNAKGINYTFDQPGSMFKKELVQRYLKQAPLMYQVSRPPQVIDVTQDQKKEMDVHSRSPSRRQRIGPKNAICNE